MKMLSWDHSHDWVVQRFYNDLTRVMIRFERGGPSLNELIALRRCLPQFRDTPPAKLQDAIGSTGLIDLGAMPTPDAKRLIKVTQAAGLDVQSENVSFIRFLPFDRTTGCAWLIENDAEARFVAEAMIAAGVPVQAVEA
jgi:hypothetical protein